MRPDLSTTSSSDIFLNQIPILAKHFECLAEPLVFLVSPAAIINNPRVVAATIKTTVTRFRSVLRVIMPWDVIAEIQIIVVFIKEIILSLRMSDFMNLCIVWVSVSCTNELSLIDRSASAVFRFESAFFIVLIESKLLRRKLNLMIHWRIHSSQNVFFQRWAICIWLFCIWKIDGTWFLKWALFLNQCLVELLALWAHIKRLSAITPLLIYLTLLHLWYIYYNKYLINIRFIYIWILQ